VALGAGAVAAWCGVELVAVRARAGEPERRPVGPGGGGGWRCELVGAWSRAGVGAGRGQRRDERGRSESEATWGDRIEARRRGSGSVDLRKRESWAGFSRTRADFSRYAGFSRSEARL
jgi:hypothetical protein